MAGPVLWSGWGGGWSGTKSSRRSGSEVRWGRPCPVPSPVEGLVVSSMGALVPGLGGGGGSLVLGPGVPNIQS